MLRDTAKLLSGRALRRLLNHRDEAISFAQQVGLRRAAQASCALLGEEDPAPGELAGWQREVLASVLDRMCAYDGDDLPAPAQTDALEAAVGFTSTMPPSTRQKLFDLLSVFELGAAALGPQRERKRFTQMDTWAQDQYLAAWEASPIEPMRAGFHGLKSVCMMGYWTRPGTWPAISYGLDTEGGFTGHEEE